MGNLAEWLRGQKVVWLLVREDGSALLAAPLGKPVERFLLPSGEAPRTVQDCVAVAEAVLARPAMGLEGLVVSVPWTRPDLHELERLLEEHRAKPLDQEQLQDLEDTGMDVPFGDWADPGRARLFLLASSERGATARP